ncbi:hypothetical protein QE382_002787 [Sphingobacterium zeae]|uniref:Uncharacterized protein n=1 Tax=Sphingobacterium zeae TaxID=1776859 RepID=A0ABU0U761_9SPHI|nr:hypothetical protein [Sphingobacterium zeae]
MKIQTGGELYCLMEYIIREEDIEVNDPEVYAAPDGASCWCSSL